MDQNNTTIIGFVGDIPDIVEKGEFEKEDLNNSRSRYFGDVPTEAVLLKYCIGMKEMKVVLQFLFSVYNYVKDLRRVHKKFQHSVEREKDDVSSAQRESANMISKNLKRRIQNSASL